MDVSIGILAHDEAGTIPAMLRSVFAQTLLLRPDPAPSVQIVVVANGCTDQTAAAARAALATLGASCPPGRLAWSVEEVVEPGKANAWNLFVHGLAAPSARYLILLDADIELLDPQTLASMVRTLEDDPRAWVAVDRPIKHVARRGSGRSLRDLLSLRVSELASARPSPGTPARLCGQAYCARAAMLRKLWLPRGLPTQDGFLYTLIASDGLCEPKRPERVVLAGSACHTFEALTDLRRLIRHEQWLVAGAAVSVLLYDDLRSHAQGLEPVGRLIRERNEADGEWLRRLLDRRLRDRWWLIPEFVFWRRFKSLRHGSVGRALLLFPLALAAFAVDAVVAVLANRDLHRGAALRYWREAVPRGPVP